MKIRSNPRFLKYIFYISLLFVVLSCNRKSNQDPGWTAESLQMPGTISYGETTTDPGSAGSRLVSEYCSQCHATPSPSAHSASDWVPVFRRMILLMEKSGQRGRMGGMMGGRGNMPMGMMGANVPSAEQQTIMLRYLQANALKAIPEDQVPDSGSIEASLFKQQCSRCHALPAPVQHTPQQWPAVVSRMQKHVEESNLPPISNKDASLIARFLENQSSENSK